MNFIPSVKIKGDKFSIIYEPYLKNPDYLKCYQQILENDFLDMETTRKLIDKYLNYLIFNFMTLKVSCLNHILAGNTSSDEFVRVLGYATE